jgi:hypothetical protein
MELLTLTYWSRDTEGVKALRETYWKIFRSSYRYNTGIVHGSTITITSSSGFL